MKRSASLARVIAPLTQQGLLQRQGTLADATLIAAPCSTKNQGKQRDPAMSQSRKGLQWYFGANTHIGVDMDSASEYLLM